MCPQSFFLEKNEKKNFKKEIKLTNTKTFIIFGGYRNMYRLRHKVSNGQIYPLEVRISSISKRFFQTKIKLSILGFQKHIAFIRL